MSDYTVQSQAGKPGASRRVALRVEELSDADLEAISAAHPADESVAGQIPKLRTTC
jgi:hypothetical protein